ncbi:hypothetical protein BH24BAC1_BH24BAC1_08760 [soil metagenome]
MIYENNFFFMNKVAHLSNRPFGNRCWRVISASVVMLHLLLAFPFSSYAQRYFTFDNPRVNQVTVPFQFHRNLIILETYVNQKGPFNFMLDTGISISLIIDPTLRDTLQIKEGRTVKVVGAGEDDELEALIATGLEMSFGGVTGRNLTVAVLSEDVLSLSNYLGFPIHGILGYDLMSSFVAEINFVEHQLILRHPDKFRLKRKDKPIPITLEHQKPYIVAKGVLNDSTSMPLKLVIDTGAGHGLSLEIGSDPAIQLPDKTLEAQLGRGLGGIINGHLGRIQRLTIDNYQLRNVITSYPDHGHVMAKLEQVHRHGNLGNEVLKRFRVVFDYHRTRIILRPNRFYREPFEHDMVGAHLMADGKDYRRYFIYRVEPGSPAELAGLQAGDEILSINLLPVTQMPITQIDRLFRSKDKQVLFLRINRKGENLFTLLTLHRRI